MTFTLGFNMKLLKFLIMDEADRILNMDFEAEVDKILRAIPRERKTYLFSATMTAKGERVYWKDIWSIFKLSFSKKPGQSSKDTKNVSVWPC